jgi:hypothetical protein
MCSNQRWAVLYFYEEPPVPFQNINYNGSGSKNQTQFQVTLIRIDG